MNVPKVVHETFDDNEVVIINLESGSYYSLDNIGAEIWTLIESGASVTEIIEEIIDRYEPGTLNISESIHNFLIELQQEQLIVGYTNGNNGAPQMIRATKAAPIGKRPSFQVPAFQKYTDMQDLLLLDPIHEVDETGWPKVKED
ncbi:MAG TPA: PqqD family protein [Acidobacteriota bacterium]|nr:PqqD family protein [Acidobacteriota bacterium]